MDKRIELELRGQKPDEIKDLNLDNCRATQIVGITDEFKNLEHLSIINVCLQTLKGFPNLPALKRLDLSDNRLNGGLENLCGAENLTHLNLSGNKIDDIKCIEPLQKLQKLKSLDMFNCEVCNVEDYRSKVFGMLPTLKYLDGFDQADNECSSSDEEGDEEEDEETSEGESGAEDDDGEDEEQECGLAYLQSSNAAHDEDETEDFEPSGDVDHDEDDDDDDEDIDDEDEESSEVRGTKRKLEDEASN